ncbi:MAG: hypothetical protein QOF01_2002 [Thermomicrobiales bacterium]|jgi:hypothetical protein|nr:hypothetical protein [Thermomicrobiales bacterium]
MSTQVRTEIEIQATPARVWDVLTDFADYPDWNPFIPRIAGPVEVGARLDARLQPPGGRGMSFRPTVLAATPGQELRWLGHLIVPGLFDGEHGFRIEPLGPNRVRFVQEERFAGLLAPLVLRFVERGTRQGFEAMNQALKARAEQPAPAGQ